LGYNDERQSQIMWGTLRSTIGGDPPHGVIESDDFAIACFCHSHADGEIGECFSHSGVCLVVTAIEILEGIHLSDMAQGGSSKMGVEHPLSVARISQVQDYAAVNQLSQATSPYLLQHANNPVDWWEWGDAAFAEARRRDVPIFLSIGYSACHWCHVMAHESFENPAIAQYLNDNFVSIKVDREERPDIDTIYMEATVGLTGHGGWPMSVFLDHEARPFYAGTYFPPVSRQGMTSFPQLLHALHDTWQERRSDVEAAGQRIVEALSRRGVPTSHDAELTPALLEHAVDVLAGTYDRNAAGFGGAPKFPPSMVLVFLLREAARTQNSTAYMMASQTLEVMGRGGIYDQLGGGFARYSVDADWVVPHFEKMLYDNALLLRAYVAWWRVTQSPFAERIVRHTIDFLIRELLTPEGAFASALDADSEGVEGKFYAWNRDMLADVLGSDDGEWAADLLSVTHQGTFEHGLSTLQLLRDPDDADRWDRIRSQLFLAREERIRPERDDKVIAAWNGLAIAALAEAGAAFGEPTWIQAAERAADVIVAVHMNNDGSLMRTSRDGRAGGSSGVLDDYANMAEGLCLLASATGEESWVSLAHTLIEYAEEHFDDGSGGFFTTPDNGPTLVKRPHDPSDNAEPSGWFAMASAMLALSSLQQDDHRRSRAEQALTILPAYQQAPRAAGWGLAALSALVDGPATVSVSDATASEVLRAAWQAPTPGLLVRIAPDIPAGMAMVCRHHVCQLPTADVTHLREQLRSPAVQ
jgi:uncharacterized protein